MKETVAILTRNARHPNTAFQSFAIRRNFNGQEQNIYEVMLVWIIREMRIKETLNRFSIESSIYQSDIPLFQSQRFLSLVY